MAPAKPQFIVCCTWSMMICVIMVSWRPPSSAGTMKNPIAVTNTMIAAAATPGSDCGKYTVQNAVPGGAPSVAAARGRLRSMFSMTDSMVSTASGMRAWTMPTSTLPTL
ncbi:hypothetical protein D3C87_1884810 [compost metagenome]